MARTFWGGTDQAIIRYGRILPPRPRSAEVAWFLIGLARQKPNYSRYVNATSDGRYLGHTREEQLGNVKIGAASVGFATLGNVNDAALHELLETAQDPTPADIW